MAVGLGGGGGSLLAQAYLRIRVNRSQLAGELSGCVSMFRTAVGTMAGAAAGLGGVLIARSGIHAFTSAVRALGAEMLSTNAMMERFTTSLGVMLHDNTRAASLMKEIENFAAVTPFMTQNLAEAVIQLKTFGFETDKLMPMMKTLGDAASASPAGMQLGLKRIIYAIGQIRSTGKVGSRELRQLALAGMPVWDILAAKSGKTVAELREQIKKGALSANQGIAWILQGMDERFGGMMAKQSRNWEGLLSTMSDNTRIFARKTGQDFFHMAEGKLANVVDFTLSPGFTRTTELIRAVVRDVSEFAGKKIDLGIEWLKGDGAIQTAKSIGSIAKSFVEISTTTFGNVTRFLASEPVREVGAALKDVATHLITISTTKLIDFTKWLNSGAVGEFAHNIAQASENVGGLVMNLLTLGSAYVIVTKLTGLIKLLTTETVALMLACAANPIIALTAALTALATAYVSAKIAGEGFGDHILHLAHNILQLDTALSKLEANNANEAKDSAAFHTAHEALKAGDGATARTALEKIKETRDSLDMEIAADEAAIKKNQQDAGVNPFSGEMSAESADMRAAINEKKARKERFDYHINNLEDNVKRAEVTQQVKAAATAAGDSAPAQWAKEQAEALQRRNANKPKGVAQGLGGIIGNALLHPMDAMANGREIIIKQIADAHKAQLAEDAAAEAEALGVDGYDPKHPAKYDRQVMAARKKRDHLNNVIDLANADNNTVWDTRPGMVGKAKPGAAGKLDPNRKMEWNPAAHEGSGAMEPWIKDKKTGKWKKDVNPDTWGGGDQANGRDGQAKGKTQFMDPMSFVKHIQMGLKSNTEVAENKRKAEEDKAKNEALKNNNQNLANLTKLLEDGGAKIKMMLS